MLGGGSAGAPGGAYREPPHGVGAERTGTSGSTASSPHAARPAVDILVQARSGLAFEQYSDRPLRHALPAPAYGAALMGLAGLFAALAERQSRNSSTPPPAA